MMRDIRGVLVMLVVASACFTDNGSNPLIKPDPASTSTAPSTAATTGDSSTSSSSTTGESPTSSSISTSTSTSTEASTTTAGSSSTSSQACDAAEDCTPDPNECIDALCIEGQCAYKSSPAAKPCNNLADQCDGHGNCIECVDNGGCQECCICEANVCVPA